MSWVERTDRRQERSKTWQDDQNPRKFSLDAVMTPLHYEDLLDSGEYSLTIDCTPVRVSVAAFDGWRITQNGWHYALGRDLANHGDEDGWIGFGGRKGSHWLKFRLLRCGYLYWPERVWDDIGGAPDYKRQNLTQELSEIDFPTDGSSQQVGCIARWAGLWTTPGQGSLDVSWKLDGNGLKELITINQAAREWIQANHPPATPAADTYFGFVFKLDWSDVPRIYRQGILQNLDGEFIADGESIELKDAQDRLLAFIPFSTVRVPSDRPEPANVRLLRKRYYKDGDDHYLLVGLRCDKLNELPAGDLVFDPTVDKQIATTADDGVVYNNSYSNSGDYVCAGHWGSADYFTWQRFTGVTISGTIDTSYAQYYYWDRLGSSIYLAIYGIDEDDPAAPANRPAFYDDCAIHTTAKVDWDYNFSSGWNTTPSLNTIFQELVDTYEISNEAVMIHLDNDGSTGDNSNCFYDYTGSSANSPKLHIEYTAAAGDSLASVANVKKRNTQHLLMR